MTSEQCACRQAERENRTKELRDALSAILDVIENRVAFYGTEEFWDAVETAKRVVKK